MSSCYRSSAGQSFNHHWSTFSYSAPLPLLTEPTKGASITPPKPKFQLYLRSAWSPRSAAPVGTSSCWCSSDSPWCCLHSLPDFPLWSSWKGKKAKQQGIKLLCLATWGKCCCYEIRTELGTKHLSSVQQTQLVFTAWEIQIIFTK